MVSISRASRLLTYTEGLVAVLCLAVLAVVSWRHHDPTSLAALGLGAVVLFFAPYLVRHTLIRHYLLVRTVLIAGLVVSLGVALLRADPIDRTVAIALGLGASLTLGVFLWCLSDPLYELMSWLAKSTRRGRAPDEIHQVDVSQILWPGSDTPARSVLFRIRYDDAWGYGVVGPACAASFRNDLDGQSPGVH